MVDQLPDDPMPGIIGRLRTALGAAAALVSGERPAELLEHLDCVTVTRAGGLAVRSAQSMLGDAPLCAVNCYAMGLPAAYALATAARRAVDAIGGREVTGPLPTPDEAEPAGVRRVTFTFRIVTR